MMSWNTQFTELTSRLPLFKLPHLLWQYYLEYLWFYEPDSWVARVAYTFRVLAFVFITPMVFITLLDVTSYLIARTLGVVDDVRASTSDKITIHTEADVPSVVLTASTPTITTVSTELPLTDAQCPDGREIAHPIPTHPAPQTFFASADMQLKLSGEGVFSPAASQPPSPTITRRHLANIDRSGEDD